ncbi:lysophospholipid acyltransferase family protein [Polyangium fumosum]|uniref:lysophospholipid acyltransferase family protein n=1 Tax=Polyangium fumosum TaxID=889272 RepID=UPI001478A0F0|nr:lysophospholipid acyltransferase family protein [Polyangium fumosum]
MASEEPVADVREGGTWTPRQRLKNDVVYVLVRALLAFALFLPRRALGAVCRALGFVAYVVLPRTRRIVAARLEAGLGSSNVRAQSVFTTVAAMLADTLDLLRPGERAGARLSLDPASRRVFAEALAEGRGVVFVAAHLGPWERMAALLVEEGFPVATVARESYDPRFTELYERLRRPRGVRSLYRGRRGVALSIARELAKGRAVGFLVDVPARVPSVTRRLFGADVLVPIGPARIALARRAAVVVGTCAPATSGSNASGSSLPIVQISRVPLDDLGPDSCAEDVLMTRITAELERRIAAWPEAWLGSFVSLGRPAALRGALDPH